VKILPARFSVAAAALVLATLSSCSLLNRTADALDVVNLPETRAYNLEQLHQPDHHHRHLAHQTGDIEYLMKRGMSSFTPGLHVYDENKVKKIDDPSIECLAELISLCEFNSNNPRTSSMQVEWCVRIAVEDAWRLSRERALLELGRAAQRLDVGVPQPLGPDEEASTVDDVVAAITLMIRAYRPMLERSEKKITPEEWTALEDAVAGVRALTLDLDAGRRTLRAVNALLGPAKRKKRTRGYLDPLALDLQRRLVSLAINAALNDPLPAVRGAAIHAAVVSGGDLVLAQSLTQLSAQTSEEVIISVMRIIEVRGLPEETNELSGERFERARHQWLAIMIEFATSHPAGEVRVRCMRALREVTGSGVTSLREEDWHDWWVSEMQLKETGIPLLP